MAVLRTVEVIENIKNNMGEKEATHTIASLYIYKASWLSFQTNTNINKYQSHAIKKNLNWKLELYEKWFSLFSFQVWDFDILKNFEI